MTGPQRLGQRRRDRDHPVCASGPAALQSSPGGDHARRPAPVARQARHPLVRVVHPGHGAPGGPGPGHSPTDHGQEVHVVGVDDVRGQIVQHRAHRELEVVDLGHDPFRAGAEAGGLHAPVVDLVREGRGGGGPAPAEASGPHREPSGVDPSLGHDGAQALARGDVTVRQREAAPFQRLGLAISGQPTDLAPVQARPTVTPAVAQHEVDRHPQDGHLAQPGGLPARPGGDADHGDPCPERGHGERALTHPGVGGDVVGHQHHHVRRR